MRLISHVLLTVYVLQLNMATSIYLSMAAPAMPPYMDGPMPEFVSLDDKYICVYCEKLLKQPQQTMCGHRICGTCVDTMLKDKPSVNCPGGDELCEAIGKESVGICLSCYIHIYS